MRQLKSHRCFEGQVQFWEHESSLTRTPMRFSTFIPEGEVRGALIWLSGLTCTEENFITKAGAQKYLAEQGLMVVCPDTSPRGLDLAGEHESYDFGSGAGFYLNALTRGYKDHYKMYSYIRDELLSVLNNNFPCQNKFAIFGHSMGGHGALTIGLKNPERFLAVSAFSPIVNPVAVPWGQKAFSGYLGEGRSQWRSYDACCLIEDGYRHPNPILIDQGLADEFLAEELKTSHIEVAAREHGQKIEVKYREGYDHSYYYIATFVGEHIKYLAQFF